MDERQLKDLLNNDVPGTDENARKRAVNLALAEFSSAQKDSQKNLQGKGFWTRLTDRSNQNPRRDKMNKQMIYGGMATALGLMLIVTPMMMSTMMNTVGQGGAVQQATGLGSLSFGGAGQQVATNTPREAPAAKVSGLYARAVTETNESAAAPAPMAKMKAEASMDTAGAVTNVMATPAMPPMMAGAVTRAFPSQMDMIAQPGYHDVGRDKFEHVEDSPVKQVKAEPVSTFSIDVDTSSYSFIRKQLNSGVLPQKDAVRVEEMVNYFDYNYALPENRVEPFKPTVTVTPSPWNEGHKLVHIGIKGYDLAATAKPRSNLVFLIDTSGSMNEQDKLPLLKNSFKMLLDSLKADDTVSIVTYAGSAGIALEPTKVSDKAKIIAALDSLGAGGGTAGAEGIRTAYQLAEANLDKNGVNRVILATDGDFNIGITDHNELKSFIERERASGVFLSVLGFGQGNYNDQMMQDLAQNGNGVAAYIDNLNEARKVLVQEASSTLFTIARDVKIQVEFNPATVAEYRLVGYETRALNKEDFNNDKVDAGDIGAGHAVTAIYDITPVGAAQSVDPSRYVPDKNEGKTEETKADAGSGNEYGFLKLRYKLPDGDTSRLITTPIPVAGEKPLANTKCPAGAQCLVADGFGASDDVRFSVAVAGFGQLLKGGKYTGKLTYDDIITMAQGAKGDDPYGYRAEFINLVRLAKTMPALPNTEQ
jgi:Ca-activated chloride channel family protein